MRDDEWEQRHTGRLKVDPEFFLTGEGDELIPIGTLGDGTFDSLDPDNA